MDQDVESATNTDVDQDVDESDTCSHEEGTLLYMTFNCLPSVLKLCTEMGKLVIDRTATVTQEKISKSQLMVLKVGYGAKPILKSHPWEIRILPIYGFFS